MKKLLSVLLIMVATVAVLAVAGVAYIRNTGLVARSAAGAVEARLARAARALAIPASARERPNPVPASEDVLQMGRSHFADHCAICHANDGSGDVEMGRNLFPKAPDMRTAATQELTDGELFWLIENGIRFTGMPGWSTGTPEGEEASWHLVHFIRRLPEITQAEIELMEEVNPRPPAEIRQEFEAERFLQGGDSPQPVPPHAH